MIELESILSFYNRDNLNIEKSQKLKRYYLLKQNNFIYDENINSC